MTSFDLSKKNIVGVFNGINYDLTNITYLDLYGNMITEIINIPDSVTFLNLSCDLFKFI
jgi:Leucine-rich repeat (LRR) protein